MELFRTSRMASQYRLLVWADLLLPGGHFDFRHLLEGLPNGAILITVMQNLGRIVSTRDIIKKIL